MRHLRKVMKQYAGGKNPRRLLPVSNERYSVFSEENGLTGLMPITKSAANKTEKYQLKQAS